MEQGQDRIDAARALFRERGLSRRRRVPLGREEPVMGAAKKAKHDAKAVKHKGKKDAGKVKHKGKKVKKAAKH